MKNTNNIIKVETKLAKALIANADYCNRYIDGKDFDGYKKAMETLNNSFYAFYLEKEKDGEKVTELENACYTALRGFLAMVGKVNGVSIKSGSKTGDNSTLFLDCVAFCHKSKKRVKNAELAHLISEKKIASKKAKEILDANNVKGYKEQLAIIADIDKQIKAKQDIKGVADKYNIKNSVNAFARAFEERLRSVIMGQLSQNEDELKAEKERLNAERKARRNANKPKAKATATPKKVATEKKVAKAVKTAVATAKTAVKA